MVHVMNLRTTDMTFGMNLYSADLDNWNVDGKHQITSWLLLMCTKKALYVMVLIN